MQTVHRKDCYDPTWIHYLPTRFSYISEVGEMVLYPVIDILQGHFLIRLAVDRKLDHGRVGIRWSFKQRALNCTHLSVCVLWLKENTGTRNGEIDTA